MKYIHCAVLDRQKELFDGCEKWESRYVFGNPEKMEKICIHCKHGEKKDGHKD